MIAPDIISRCIQLVPEPAAMLDSEGRLLFSNDPYRGISDGALDAFIADQVCSLRQAGTESGTFAAPAYLAKLAHLDDLRIGYQFFRASTAAEHCLILCDAGGIGEPSFMFQFWKAVGTLSSVADELIQLTAAGQISEYKPMMFAAGLLDHGDPVGQSIFDLLPPGHRVRWQQAIAEALAGQVPVLVEEQAAQGDSGRRYLECRFNIIRPGDVMVLVRDVTAAREAHKLVQDRNRQLDLILSQFPDRIFHADETGRVIEFWGQADTKAGVAVNLLDLLPPDLRPRARRALHEAAARDRPVILEFSQRSADGQTGHFELRIIRFGAQSVIALLREVTELYRNTAIAAQAARLSTLGEMASNVVHELNQPLFILNLTVETLLKSGESEPLPSQVASRIESMRGQLARIINTVQSLRIFSRRDEDEQSDIDVRPIILSVTDLMSKMLETAGIGIDVRVPDASVMVRGHPNWIYQIMLNLIGNARDAILAAVRQEAGRARSIGVRLEVRQGGAVVSVSDTGFGISPEVLPRIFDPFYTTKTANEGTGLGLAICQRLMHAMKGNISVTTSEDGATFVLELPLLGTATAGG